MLSDWQATIQIRAPAKVQTSGVRRPSKLGAPVSMKPWALAQIAPAKALERAS
jgi:hypothetical protein